MSRTHGAIPPLSNTPSWHDAQLKRKGMGTTLSLPLYTVTNYSSSINIPSHNQEENLHTLPIN
jgi:hypothetical protein